MTRFEQYLKAVSLPGAVLENNTEGRLMKLVNVVENQAFDFGSFSQQNKTRRALTLFKSNDYNLYVVMINSQNRQYLIGPVSISDYRNNQVTNTEYLIFNGQIKQVEKDRVFQAVELALVVLNVYLRPRKIRARLAKPQLTKIVEKKNSFLKVNESGVHVSYAFERQINYAVLNNDPDEIKKSLYGLYRSGRIGILSDKGQLRNMIDFGIIVISTNIRVALRNGMDFDLAYSLNDFYVHRLEEQTEVGGIFTCIEESLIDLGKQLHSKIVRGVPPLVLRACRIMLTEANENITVKGLAGRLNISANYFSTLFKKWIGLSVSEFRMLAKVNYSFILLTSTGLSIADVAFQMGFSDQAYFSNVFKKFTHVTPNEYREDPLLLKDWSIYNYIQKYGS